MNVQVEDMKGVVENAFNFNVIKMPLSAPDNIRTPYYGLFRDDTSECVGNGSVSSRYHPHTTDDVLSLVEAASEAFDGEVSLRCHFRDGHYVAVSPTNEHRIKIYGEKDTVFPQIVISAGFDGRAFTATMGYYRDLCQNLAMLSSVNGTHVSIRHTRSLRTKMNDLIATFGKLNDGDITNEEKTRIIKNLESVKNYDFTDNQSFGILLGEFNVKENNPNRHFKVGVVKKRGVMYYSIEDKGGVKSIGNQIWAIVRNNSYNS